MAEREGEGARLSSAERRKEGARCCSAWVAACWAAGEGFGWASRPAGHQAKSGGFFSLFF